MLIVQPSYLPRNQKNQKSEQAGRIFAGIFLAGYWRGLEQSEGMMQT